MKDNTGVIKVIDHLALLIMGVVILGYVLFQVRLAERHVQFAFLDFPVFVGEFLLMTCGVLFLMRIILRPPRLQWLHGIIVAYFTFVVFKAVTGYVEWGPLAFRHAALMYYPVFILFGFTFFRREYLSEPIKLLLVAAIAGVLGYREYYAYCTLSLYVLGILMSLSLHHKGLRYAGLLLVLVLTPYDLFFNTARMMMLGQLVFVIYLCSVTMLKLRWPAWTKIVTVVVVFGLTVSLLSHFAGGHKVRSIFDFPKLMQIFHEFDEEINRRKQSYVPMELPKGKIYNPNTPVAEEPSIRNDEERRAEKHKAQQADSSGKRVTSERDGAASSLNSSTFKSEANNAVCRLLIWRDMYVEYRDNFSLFGFDYGKPLRSISLEVMRWVASEWQRDGWVSAHNSFLHIIYRSGIVGICFIVGILAVWFRMVAGFMRRNMWTGIVLCGLILSWFVAANFLIVLEIPYSAIPIWTLYGLTLKYYWESRNDGEPCVEE